jgi:hypothetical protein
MQFVGNVILGAPERGDKRDFGWRSAEVILNFEVS